MSDLTRERRSGIDAEGDEPLLSDLGDRRFSLFPLQFPDIFEAYKKHLSMFWTVDECDFSTDRKDFERLTPDERKFVVSVLSFFAASDLLVNANLLEHFAHIVTWPEVRSYYTVQACIETVHTECYATMLQSLCTEEEQERAFTAIQHVPSIRRKHDWAVTYTRENVPFVERLVAFATFEGVLFASSFAAIYHFKQRGVMPGLCFSNELISRDESMHADFATLLYTRHVRHKLSDERVHAIVGDAVEAEEQFVRESLHADIVGLSADKMVRYVHHVANRLLVAMGHPALYDDAASLPYMDNISIDSSGNFFETRINQYAKRSATAGDIELDSEF